jgi:hypothetical protein
VFLSDWSSKAPQNNVFFLRCVFITYCVFGRFSVRGVQKHEKEKKVSKKSDPPTHPGVTDFFFGGPLPWAMSEFAEATQ